MTDCINCPNCGAPVDLTAEKCPYCGTPYRRTMEPVQTLQEVLDSVAAALITPNEARRLMGLPRV